MRKIFVIVLVLIGIIEGRGQSDKKLMQEKMKALDEYLEYAVVNNDFSGQVLVADDHNIWIDQGYGLSDKEENVEIDPKTVFDIGEVAGQFTATAILKLEEEGKLSVVDNISKFFSYVPKDKANITLNHLITHTSGLPEELGGDYEVVSRSEMIKNVLNAPLEFTPGAKYSYSKAGYNLLAAIIEIVSGEFYEKYLNKKLFSKSHMHQTGYTVPKFSDKDIAVGYSGAFRWGKPGDHVLGSNGPSWYAKGHSGFLSNATDLYAWYHAVHGEHIIGPDNVYRLYLPQVDMPNGDVFCYGWIASHSEHGGGVIKTEGNNDVFDTKFNIYLESGMVIIFMTNAYNDGTEEIFNRIEQHVFN